MGVELCLEALQMALKSQGQAPQICNTDQGSQFIKLFKIVGT